MALPIPRVRTRSPQRAPSTMEGTWCPPDGKSLVTIRRDPVRKDTFTGHISWMAEEKRGQLDRRNPSPELRTRRLLGLPIFLNFSGAGTDGHIYDPNFGKKIPGSLQVVVDDGASSGDEESQRLRVKGWVGIGPLSISRTYHFTRVTQPPRDLVKASSSSSTSTPSSERTRDRLAA